MFLSFFSVSASLLTGSSNTSAKAIIVTPLAESKKFIAAPDPRPPQPITPAFSSLPSSAKSGKLGM